MPDMLRIVCDTYSSKPLDNGTPRNVVVSSIGLDRVSIGKLWLRATICEDATRWIYERFANNHISPTPPRNRCGRAIENDHSIVSTRIDQCHRERILVLKPAAILRHAHNFAAHFLNWPNFFSSTRVTHNAIMSGFDISSLLQGTSFEPNQWIRGAQLTFVGANRALQNPGLFTSEHYRQAALAVAAGIAIRILVALPVMVPTEFQQFPY